MQYLDIFLRALHDSNLANNVRENELLFPWIESFHILTVSWVMGSIAYVDLRILGLFGLDEDVDSFNKNVLPVTWIAFFLSCVTGAILFTSNALNYYNNIYFQVKMIMLILIGINMTLYQFVFKKKNNPLENHPFEIAHIKSTKVFCLVSLICWFVVVVMGRLIGFTLELTLS
jgi:hypothetical protein